jgi:hypothetical protein
MAWSRSWPSKTQCTDSSASKGIAESVDKSIPPRLTFCARPSTHRVWCWSRTFKLQTTRRCLRRSGTGAVISSIRILTVHGSASKITVRVSKRASEFEILGAKTVG